MQKVTQPRSLHLEIKRDDCMNCRMLEMEDFFTDLDRKLKLGPNSACIFNNARSSLNDVCCPVISCSFVGDDRADFTNTKVFNMDYSDESGWKRTAEQKKFTILNVQDFCDRFISENEELIPAKKAVKVVEPTPVVVTGMTMKESFFSAIVFMLRDNREYDHKRINIDTLPSSVISVRKMLDDLDLVGKVTSCLEPLDGEFWEKEFHEGARGPCGLRGPCGCMGNPSICSCFQCKPRSCTYLENNCIVLKISGETLVRSPKHHFDFKLTRGPRDNTLDSIYLNSATKTVTETSLLAIVPCPEAYEVMNILASRIPELTIADVCRGTDGLFGNVYVDRVKIKTRLDAPHNTLDIIAVEDTKTFSVFKFTFRMIVTDLEANLDNIKEFFNDIVVSGIKKRPFEWNPRSL